MTSAGRRRGSRMRTCRSRIAPTTRPAPASCAERGARRARARRARARPAPRPSRERRRAGADEPDPREERGDREDAADERADETTDGAHPPTVTSSPVAAPKRGNDVAAPARSRAANAGVDVAEQAIGDEDVGGVGRPTRARARSRPGRLPPPPTSTTPTSTPTSAAARRASRSRPRSAAAPTTTARCA